jgi:hypothetical protein
MGGYFFSLTKISLNSFLSANINLLMDAIISTNFLLFALTTSIGLGILISIGSFYKLNKASLISIPFYIFAIIITTVAFGLLDFFIPLIIGVFAIPICFTSIQKAREFKVFPILRAGVYSSGKFILIIAASLSLSLLLAGMLQADSLENNFTNEMLNSTVGSNVTLEDQFTLQLASSISSNQAKTIELMLDQNELKNLVQSGSIDAINYNQKLLAYKSAYEKDDYKSKLGTELKNSNLKMGEELLTKFPIIKAMAKYAFVIYPFSAFILIMFFGNFIFKNIAGIIFAAIIKIIYIEEETEQKA